jgi:hypothetical protein
MIDGTDWVARAGLAGASGICLEVHVEGGADDRICSLREGESGLWRFEESGAAFVAGTIDDPDAASVRLTLADGSVVSAAVVGASGVTSLRFFVLAVAQGSPLDRLEILDAAGTVIENRPLD